MNLPPQFQAPSAGTRLVSADVNGIPTDGFSGNPTYSPDGTKVAFVSHSSNLVDGLSGDAQNVFLKDLVTGEVTLVSVAPGGIEANGLSGRPVFSPDGSRIIFLSTASNLVPGDTNGASGTADLFISDLRTGLITRVSTTSKGAQTDGVVGEAVFSPDGSKIAFMAVSDEYLADDTNGAADVFIKDLVTGEITRVSTDSNGKQVTMGWQGQISFSPAGDKIAFISGYDNFTPEGQDGAFDASIYVKDLTTGEVEVFGSVGPGSEGIGVVPYNDYYAIFSPDGAWLAFQSEGFSGTTIHIVDLASGEVSVLDGHGGVGLAFSPDGRKIAYISDTLHVVDLTNGTEMRVEGAYWSHDQKFEFSPDGNSVLYNTDGQVHIAQLGNGPATYEENSAPLQIVQSVFLSDVDSASYAGGALRVAITGGFVPGDELSLFTSLITGRGIGLSGKLVTYNGAAIGTFSGGAKEWSFSLNGNATDAAVKALAEAMRISSSSEAPTDAVRGVTFTLIDGGGTTDGGTDRASFKRKVDFIGIDDPQVIAFSGRINERSVVGTLVGTATASDPDGAGSFTYGLEDDFGGRFAIDPQTGTITVTKPDLDYETHGQPLITIRVEDAAGSSSTASFQVGLNDIPEVVYGTDNSDALAIPAIDRNWTAFGRAGDDTLTGSDGSDYLLGQGGDDHLLAKGGADRLEGGAGNDRLDGGAGTDTMYGGGGNDSFAVDDIGDAVIEVSATGGIDLVQSAVSYTLGANIENLTLTGSAPNGTGNGLANAITGTGAANVLNGLAGADTLIGRGGNDVYVVDNVGDLVVEGASTGGTDMVQSSVTFTLGTNVEHLTLTGSAAIKATGNALGNAITGNSGANRLDGLDGNDVLQGLGGADALVGGAGADRLHSGAGKDALTGGAGKDGFYFDTALDASLNVDTIGDFAAADDTIFLDRSIFKGIAADGALAASAFQTGKVAQEADDRILYDQASGKIFYDADGVGAVAAVLFAQVTAGTALTNADFSAVA